MRIILLEDVENLGKKGEVKEVAFGYARNFLIPRKLAVLATRGKLKQREEELERLKKKKEQLQKEAEALKEKLEKQVFQLEIPAGPKGKLFGAVTAKEIADLIKKETGIPIDKKQIEEGPIKESGEHKITLKLFEDIKAKIQLKVKGTKSKK